MEHFLFSNRTSSLFREKRELNMSLSPPSTPSETPETQLEEAESSIEKKAEKEAKKRAEQAAEGVPKSEKEATRQYIESLKQQEERDAREFDKALKETAEQMPKGDERKQVKNFGKENRSDYRELSQEGGAGKVERYSRELQKYKYAPADGSWGLCDKVGIADSRGDFYLYRREINAEGNPVLEAMSPAGGYSVCDLRTGKWTFKAAPLSADMLQEWQMFRNDLAKSGEDSVDTYLDQAARNRDVERKVLRAPGMNPKQFRQFQVDDPNFWDGRENERSYDRLDNYITAQQGGRDAEEFTEEFRGRRGQRRRSRRERRPGRVRGSVTVTFDVDAQQRGPQQGPRDPNAPQQNVPEQPATLEQLQQLEKMKNSLNEKFKAYHEKMDNTPGAFAGSPIATFFATTATPFGNKGNDRIDATFTGQGVGKAASDIAAGIGYKREGNNLVRSRDGKVVELAGSGATESVTMDLHEWLPNSSDPKNIAEHLANADRIAKSIDYWGSKVLAVEPAVEQFNADFDEAGENVPEKKGDWVEVEDGSEASAIKGDIKRLAGRLPSGFKKMPFGRFLSSVDVKFDRESGRVVLMAPKDNADFRHVYGMLKDKGVGVEVEKVAEKGADGKDGPVQFGMLVNPAQLKRYLVEHELRLAGETTGYADGSGGIGGEGPGENLGENPEEKPPENLETAEVLRTSLEGMLKDKGESVKRQAELQEKVEKIPEQIKTAEDAITNYKNIEQEQQKIANDFQKEMDDLEDGLDGDTEDTKEAIKLLFDIAKRRVLRNKASAERETAKAEALGEEMKDIKSEIEAANKNEEVINAKIKDKVDKILEQLGEEAASGIEYDKEEGKEPSYAYTLDKTLAGVTLKDGTENPSLEDLLKRVKEKAEEKEDEPDAPETVEVKVKELEKELLAAIFGRSTFESPLNEIPDLDQQTFRNAVGIEGPDDDGMHKINIDLASIEGNLQTDAVDKLKDMIPAGSLDAENLRVSEALAPKEFIKEIEKITNGLS